MPITFYPNPEDVHRGSIPEYIELMTNAAEQYKAVVLDKQAKAGEEKHAVPRDITISYNWEAITELLQLVRELPEGNKEDKTKKSQYLTKLADVYEILRSAKMPKLEAVRLALTNEARQLA